MKKNLITQDNIISYDLQKDFDTIRSLIMSTIKSNRLDLFKIIMSKNENYYYYTEMYMHILHALKNSKDIAHYIYKYLDEYNGNDIYIRSDYLEKIRWFNLLDSIYSNQFNKIEFDDIIYLIFLVCLWSADYFNIFHNNKFQNLFTKLVINSTKEKINYHKLYELLINMLRDIEFKPYVEYILSNIPDNIRNNQRMLIPREFMFYTYNLYIDVAYYNILDKLPKIPLIDDDRKELAYKYPLDNDLIIARSHGVTIDQFKNMYIKYNWSEWGRWFDDSNGSHKGDFNIEYFEQYFQNYDTGVQIAMNELSTKYILVDDINSIIYSYFI